LFKVVPVFSFLRGIRKGGVPDDEAAPRPTQSPAEEPPPEREAVAASEPEIDREPGFDAGRIEMEIAPALSAPAIDLASNSEDSDPIIAIDFTAGGNSQRYLTHGWSYAEADFTWTNGDESALRVKLPDAISACRFVVTVDALNVERRVGLSAQPVYVLANGIYVGKAVLDRPATFEFVVPPSAGGPGAWLAINFLLPAARRPGGAPAGGDNRRLALAMSSIAIFDHAPGALLPPADLPDRDLLLCFENLGCNCEFGLVQRDFEAEPIGLFRWAATSADILSNVLHHQFADVGDFSNIDLVTDLRQEYMARDLRYGFYHHTYVGEGEIDAALLRIREAKRFRFLAEKLREDLAEATKIFVFSQKSAPPAADIERLHDELCLYGPNTLLWVVETPDTARAGHVEWRRPGLLCGYIENLATDDDITDYRRVTWLQICRAAYRLRHGNEPHSVFGGVLVKPRPGDEAEIAWAGSAEDESVAALPEPEPDGAGTTILDLSFAISGNAEPYLGTGWSPAEEEFTWTEADDSLVYFPRPSGSGPFILRLWFGPCTTPTVPQQTLEIYLNDSRIGGLNVGEDGPDECEFVLESSAFGSLSVATLRLHHPDAVRPSDHFDSDDTRRLAFAFRSISLLKAA